MLEINRQEGSLPVGKSVLGYLCGLVCCIGCAFSSTKRCDIDEKEQTIEDNQQEGEKGNGIGNSPTVHDYEPSPGGILLFYLLGWFLGLIIGALICLLV
jgi:hypothetical protein